MPEFFNNDIGVCGGKLTPKLTPDLTLIRLESIGRNSDKISSLHYDGPRNVLCSLPQCPMMSGSNRYLNRHQLIRDLAYQCGCQRPKHLSRAPIPASVIQRMSDCSLTVVLVHLTGLAISRAEACAFCEPRER